MLHIHSFALVLFILFAVAYAIGSVFVYRHLFSSKGRVVDPDKVKLLRRSKTRLIVTIVSILTTYAILRWTIGQILYGCMKIFLWSPVCYDLNEFNPAWLAIITIIGINALLLAYLYDTKWHPPHYK